MSCPKCGTDEKIWIIRESTGKDAVHDDTGRLIRVIRFFNDNVNRGIVQVCRNCLTILETGISMERYRKEVLFHVM